MTPPPSPPPRPSTEPLKPAVFHILLALSANPAHGYAVMQAVREQSRGSVPLRTGSFYRHLARMIEQGLVAESLQRGPNDDPRRGANYRVTPRGLRVLAQERERLASLVAAFDALQPAARRGPA